MDKSEKIALSLGVLMLSIFFFAIMVSAKVLKQDVPECISPEEIYEEGELVTIEEGKLYQVKYLSKMWAFEPDEISIPAGSEVDIFLASKDIVHGFYIRGTNINMMAVPGALNFKSMKFNKPGVYDIYCHEYCGTGHQFMKGRIIVTP
jgi:cytochrome c oxidase subunit II